MLTKADNLNWCLSLRSKIPVIARPVRLSGVAIPPLEGKCTENYPEEWELLRFLVVSVTWFLSTGGLPRQFANWLAMTAYTRQTPIVLSTGCYRQPTPKALVTYRSIYRLLAKPQPTLRRPSPVAAPSALPEICFFAPIRDPSI